jgi:hypothetical protein
MGFVTGYLNEEGVPKDSEIAMRDHVLDRTRTIKVPKGVNFVAVDTSQIMKARSIIVSSMKVSREGNSLRVLERYGEPERIPDNYFLDAETGLKSLGFTKHRVQVSRSKEYVLC